MLLSEDDFPGYAIGGGCCRDDVDAGGEACHIDFRAAVSRLRRGHCPAVDVVDGCWNYTRLSV